MFGVEHNISAASTTGREHAVNIRFINVIGTHSIINVWAPVIGGLGYFSLTQLWMLGEAGSGLQAVEVGSHLYPYRYGNNFSHLFIYIPLTIMFFLPTSGTVAIT